MAKRRSYKKDEKLMTQILLVDVAVFVLYLLFAGLGITALKVITAIIAIVGSLLVLGFLYMSGEMFKLRSRWLVMGYGAVVVCLLVSLVLNYPSPKPAADANDPAGSSISESYDAV